MPTPQQLGRPVFGTGRVDQRFDAIYQLEDSASSTYHGLTLALNKRLSNEFELLASYTLSKTIDDASDFDEQPANPYDLRAERALSRQDVRQRFVLSALFDLPFGDDEENKNAGQEKESLLKTVLGHIEVAPIVTLSSGRPVNTLTGADEEHSRAFPLVSRRASSTSICVRSSIFPSERNGDLISSQSSSTCSITGTSRRSLHSSDQVSRRFQALARRPPFRHRDRFASRLILSSEV